MEQAAIGPCCSGLTTFTAMNHTEPSRAAFSRPFGPQARPQKSLRAAQRARDRRFVTLGSVANTYDHLGRHLGKVVTR